MTRCPHLRDHITNRQPVYTNGITRQRIYRWLRPFVTVDGSRGHGLRAKRPSVIRISPSGSFVWMIPCVGSCIES